jgi:hypothetical protein
MHQSYATHIQQEVLHVLALITLELDDLQIMKQGAPEVSRAV